MSLSILTMRTECTSPHSSFSVGLVIFIHQTEILIRNVLDEIFTWEESLSLHLPRDMVPFSF